MTISKTSTTRREPARTASPEELDEVDGRTEEAQFNTPDPWTGPKADPELVAAAQAFMKHNDALYYLEHGEWAPTGPVELQAALRELPPAAGLGTVPRASRCSDPVPLHEDH
jgi:hypothetical protein